MNCHLTLYELTRTRLLFLLTHPTNLGSFVAERAARAHVRDDDHRRGVLDRLRAGHHHQAPRQVPQRQDRQREGNSKVMKNLAVVSAFLQKSHFHTG